MVGNLLLLAAAALAFVVWVVGSVYFGREGRREREDARRTREAMEVAEQAWRNRLRQAPSDAAAPARPAAATRPAPAPPTAPRASRPPAGGRLPILTDVIVLPPRPAARDAGPAGRQHELF
ncbi:hypothetical protein [Piscinibacter sakaiensis]|uniref:Uncharacterized protein n=1 Tax=Piscinibacter sakaiensis TaxID=1547922 RepID=A0A0K8NZ77_PISS1|nr:hypothetical protein [Piscinibacter sakaiensis]GAP35681.1 hypothetical protein ISF6_1454 [Piscinibacter sakaiensis]